MSLVQPVSYLKGDLDELDDSQKAPLIWNCVVGNCGCQTLKVQLPLGKVTGQNFRCFYSFCTKRRLWGMHSILVVYLVSKTRHSFLSHQQDPLLDDFVRGLYNLLPGARSPSYSGTSWLVKPQQRGIKPWCGFMVEIDYWNGLQFIIN